MSVSSLVSSSFLLSEGKIFSCGRNDAFQSGHSERKSSFEIIKSGALDKAKIKFLSIGYQHCIAIDENGELILWGSGSWMTSKVTKIPIALNYKEKIKFVSCGFSHTLAITETNDLCTWGTNSFGELGLGDFEPRTSPSSLKFDEKIELSAAGAHFSLIITSKFDYFN